MVTEYMSRINRVVRRATNTLRRKEYPADPDELYDMALDFVIHNVRQLTAGKATPNDINGRFNYLPLQLVQTTVRRHLKQRTGQIEEDETGTELLCGKGQEPDVEELIHLYERNAERRLTNDQEHLLLRVVYKRDDEDLDDIFCPSQKHRWQKETRPVLREWAADAGLVDGGDR